MTRGSELGRSARRRRLELGVSQSRIAEVVGVSPMHLGRWERGDDVPSPSQMRALAAALEMGPDTAETWLEEVGARTLTVEIVADPLVPPEQPIDDGLDGDPWSAPPEKRIRPPRLDRAALIHGGNGTGAGSATAVIPIVPVAPDPSIERLLKRQARLDERRLRRELIASHREEQVRTTAETRLRIAERTQTASRPARPVPAPAGAANTGSVFPVPDTKRGSERVTYQGIGEVPAGRDRLIYTLRVVGTVIALVAGAGLLWWAFGSLTDGLGAVFDLFRGGEESLGAAGFLLLG
ncbi:MAG: helix-turn-helix transcriptional regulator [Acidimicrobiia bacterium]|nr:helix-turn-helix transcriptional regulator [Acidimicrobiia bacterium]